MGSNECAVCFGEYERGIECIGCRKTICVKCFFKITISCQRGCHVTYKCPFCRKELFISEEKMCILVKNTTIESPVFINNETGDKILKLTIEKDGSVVIEKSIPLFYKVLNYFNV